MDDELRRRHMRRVGWLLFALSLAVVGVSAWLRLAGAGLGCADWPGCYADFLEGTPYALPPAGRLIHRLVATSALLVAFYASWRCLRPVPLPFVSRQVLILTGLMLLLSVVGIWSNDPRRVFVNFVNLLGGLALVSFSWRVVMAAEKTDETLLPRGDRLLTGGLLMLTASVLLGALIGARYAAVACGTFPDCDGAWWPAAWSGLNPAATLIAPIQPADPAGTALHLLHRYCAMATALLLGMAAWRTMRRATEASARRGAWIVMALLALEALLGISTVASGYSLGLAVAHNIGAAALLAAAAQLSERAARRGEPSTQATA